MLAFVEKYSWRLLALSAVVVFGIGYVGVQKQTAGLSPAECLYGSLQLFWANGQFQPDHIGWQLLFARFAAPVLTSTAFLKSAAYAFKQGYDQFLGKYLIRNHVIVCGCGEIGYRFAADAMAGGMRVLIVERSQTAPFVNDAKRLNIPVVFGDASDPRTLESAGLRRARWVAAVTSDDDANLRIADLIDTNDKLRTKCMVHVSDLAMWPLACRKFRNAERIRPVNIHEEIAVSLLNAEDPFPGGPERPSSILVVKGRERAEALVVHLAKRWQAVRDNESSKLSVTLVDDHAKMWVEHLRETYAGLDDMITLSSEEIVPSELDSVLASRLNASYNYDLAYVAEEDPNRASSLALLLTSTLPAQATAKIVALSSRDCAVVWQPEGPNPTNVDWGRSIADARRLLEGESDHMAQLAHNAYRASERIAAAREGRDPRPAARFEWEELPEYKPRHPQELDHVRAQNREQAAYAGTLLATVGCTTTSLLDWDPAPFAFDSNEVLTLAPMEHERWWNCMRSMGFKPAPELRLSKDQRWSTDYEKRRTPFYVDYSELPPANQLLDQDTIRRIPAKLVLIGLRPVRMVARVVPRTSRQTTSASDHAATSSLAPEDAQAS